MSATLLLVDDDDNDVFLMTRAMRRAGVVHPIQVAWDGREALEYLEGLGKFRNRDEHPLPCLVMLDLKLPHVMGLEVLKWLRRQEQFNSMTVVVLSASQSPDDIAAAYRGGAQAYFVKPGTVDQLDQVARTIRDSWLSGCLSRPADSRPLTAEHLVT